MWITNVYTIARECDERFSFKFGQNSSVVVVLVLGQRTNVSGSVTMAANVLNDSLLLSWNLYNTSNCNNSLGPNYSFYSLDLYPLLAYSVELRAVKFIGRFDTMNRRSLAAF